MKNKYIVDLVAGDELADSAFAVKSVNAKTTTAGKSYKDLILVDRTGRVNAKIWEDKLGLAEDCAKGDIVVISGKVESYQGRNQINVKKLVKADEALTEWSDFVQKSEKDIEKVFAEIVKRINAVKNKPLKKLLLKFYGDAEWGKILKNAPGAETFHHAYVGGLLEHTEEMLLLAEKVADLFPRVNRDLLAAGVLLHDIGKTRELSLSSVISRTLDGELIGHITIGANLVSEEIKSIKNFPETLRQAVIHLILSHHGEGQYGSPVKPMMIEAFALHYVDQMSAKMNVASRLLREYEGSNLLFTEKNFILDSKLLIPLEIEEESDKPAKLF
jgi:3'-5' exoribonuclease